jgi:ORF6N domain
MAGKHILIPVGRRRLSFNWWNFPLIVIRGERVMLDEDLAEWQNTTANALIELVQRNRDHFTGDHAVFELSKGELGSLDLPLDSKRYAFTKAAMNQVSSLLYGQKYDLQGASRQKADSGRVMETTGLTLFEAAHDQESRSTTKRLQDRRQQLRNELIALNAELYRQDNTLFRRSLWSDLTCELENAIRWRASELDQVAKEAAEPHSTLAAGAAEWLVYLEEALTARLRLSQGSESPFDLILKTIRNVASYWDTNTIEFWRHRRGAWPRWPRTNLEPIAPSRAEHRAVRREESEKMKEFWESPRARAKLQSVSNILGRNVST